MKILLKIAMATALVLITNGALRDYYLNNAGTRSAVRILDEAADAYPRPISTLFVGDSHIGRSVDPRVFGPDAYSLWSPGQCYVRSFYRLEALLEETNHPIETVVVAVSHHSFSEPHLRSITNPPWPKYVPYGEVGKTFGRSAEFGWRRARNTFMPYAGHFEDYFTMRQEDVTVEDVIALQGSLPYPEVAPPPEWTAYMATERLDEHYPLGPEPISEGYAIYLGRIIELARERGAEVVLITTPVTEVYWKEADAYLSYDAFYGAIAEQSGVEYFDYHDLLFDRPELFRDVDHVNEEGAGILSAQLLVDLAE